MTTGIDARIKHAYAGIALVAAIVLMFWGMILPPEGILDKSILYGTGQLLVFSATLAGCGSTLLRISSMVRDLKSGRYNNDENDGSKRDKKQ